MIGLRTVITLSILAVAIFADSESAEGFIGYSSNNRRPILCNSDPNKPSHLPPCSAKPDVPAKTATDEDNAAEEKSTELKDNVPDATDDTTALERAHWCRFSNGTYVPYGKEFLHTPCTNCRCTKSRTFQCQPIDCMPTFCSDNSRPIRAPGQCCTQCASDPPAKPCVENGTTYLHGAIIKAIHGEMQCWCQLGNVECRQYIGTVFDGISAMSQGIVVNIIIVILLSVVFIGLLSCCGCTALFYYYYRQNQQSFQQAYDQYVYSAGWQPMEEEEEATITSAAEEKRIEAEQNQLYYNNQEFIPPPYEVYNGAYVSEQEQK